MTIEDYLDGEELTLSEYRFFIKNKSKIEKFAKLKCQELLEIVVEKVNIRHTFTSVIDGKTTHSYDKIFSAENSMFTIDKDSILNAVDLNEFIL